MHVTIKSCYTCHHSDTHSQGHILRWTVNRLLVEYKASLQCSWVCGHTASSPQVLTHLPPTVTSRASITLHVVHRPPVSTIRSASTLHKHPTPHEYWCFRPLSGTTVPHEVSECSAPYLVQQTVIYRVAGNFQGRKPSRISRFEANSWVFSAKL